VWVPPAAAAADADAVPPEPVAEGAARPRRVPFVGETGAQCALGKRLRELRQAAGLSGRQLAESLSWPPSKVSKLENSRQTPTDDDDLSTLAKAAGIDVG
jgi:ribosome-binding protein aMBF1 (putative translation factor)